MKKNEYKVILSSRSDQMLVAHAKFLANVNPAAARELLAAFRKASDSIANGPMKYPYADDLDAADIPLFMICLILPRGCQKAAFLFVAID